MTPPVATPSANEPRLQRGIGTVQATALNMSNMVGIGPFITIPVLMTALGGPQAMLGWLVALVVALADGLVWSELGAAMPGSGGSYQFLREGFGRERWGRLMSFLFIWQFLLSGPLEIASGFIGFAQYLKYLWAGASDRAVLLAAAGAGLACIVLLYRPIGNIARIMVGLWFGTLVTIAAVIFTGATHFDAKLAFDFPPGAWDLTPNFWFGLGAASAVGMYDYLGYYNICHLGDEVREPGRVIPRSMLISLTVVAVLYVGINFSIIGIVPWRSFVPATDPPAPVVSMMMEKVWGADVAAVFTVFVLWTAFACCVALLLGYSRIPFAAARDGNFFKVFARLHPTGAFPHVALLVVGLLAVVFTFLPLMTVIAALLTTRIVVQFCGQIAALMLLRKTRPDLARPFKMWLYPLPAFIAFGGWIFLLVTTDQKQLAYGACVLALGVVAFLVVAKSARRWPFLFAICALIASASAAQKPNVLLIVADDMGFSDAACYGGDITTPNLDALAKRGLRFTQFYNTARCWPSRAAILTGYYAQSVRRDAVPGVKSGAQGTRPAWARLLPDMLRPLGYRSYHSGKWHVDGRPIEGGFDRSYSLNDNDRHFAPRQHTEDDQPLPAVPIGSGYYTSTAIADHAIKCLREHAEKYAAQPFFEFLAFTAPHFPLQAPPEDIARYKEKYLRGWDAMREERWQRMRAMGIGGSTLAPIEREVGAPYAFPAAMQKLGPTEVNRPLPWDGLTSEQREFQAAKMAVHAAMVDRMDREIGRVLAQLREMGAAENTLVFFLSDNGASAEMMVRGDGHDPDAICGTGATFLSLGPGWSSMANTPFRRHKTWVHEGGISTPLIVQWPQGIAARGELRRAPGHVIDLVPTILEVAGGKPFEKWNGQPVPPAPGKSLVPAFATDAAIARDSIWWLHEGNRALRVGDWKIVAAGKDSTWELYDLSTDRSETKNLAAGMPEKVRDLAAQWTRETEEYSALARKDAPSAEANNPAKAKDTPSLY